MGGIRPHDISILKLQQVDEFLAANCGRLSERSVTL